MDRVTGKVKFFNNAKGYGFINLKDGTDCFVHFSGIVMEGYKTLKQDEEVEFEIAPSEKGPQAINVTPLNKMKKGVTKLEETK